MGWNAKWLKEPGARRVIAISLGALVAAIALGEIVKLLFGESLDFYQESFKVSTQMITGITVILAVAGHYFHRQRVKRDAEYRDLCESIDKKINEGNKEHPEGKD